MEKKIICSFCGSNQVIPCAMNENYFCFSCEKEIAKDNCWFLRESSNETFSSSPKIYTNNLSSELIFMKKELKECGNKGLWIMIEAVKDPIERFKQRHNFFLIGGKYPQI